MGEHRKPQPMKLPPSSVGTLKVPARAVASTYSEVQP